jgi:hypothetical protein
MTPVSYVLGIVTLVAFVVFVTEMMGVTNFF